MTEKEGELSYCDLRALGQRHGGENSIVQEDSGNLLLKLPIIAHCLHLGVVVPTDSLTLLAEAENKKCKDEICISESRYF